MEAIPLSLKDVAGGALGAAMIVASACSASAATGVSVELNRLEPKDGACRVSLVIGNGEAKAFDSLKLDMVFFDKKGVIAKRLAVEAGPLRASKTSVKLFDAGDVACDAIGGVLLNDVTACGGGDQDCLGLVTTASKVDGVEFKK